MFPKDVAPGDVIIRYGDDGDNFYVIESGQYDIMVPIDGEDKKVRFTIRGHILYVTVTSGGGGGYGKCTNQYISHKNHT